MLWLGGCPAPGLTTNPLDTPEDGIPVVSVCYSPWVTDRESELTPLAAEGCAEKTVGDVAPRYWKRTFFINDCPLFKPMRISFWCEGTTAGPGGGTAAPAAPPAGAQSPAVDAVDPDPLTRPQGY